MYITIVCIVAGHLILFFLTLNYLKVILLYVTKIIQSAYLEERNLNNYLCYLIRALCFF